MDSSLDDQFYPEGRMGIGGVDAQQKSPYHYSCIEANSPKSCVDQGDRWI